uniref:Uncharacterized protein n=1 Tax=Fagus sylvatica TaxID=28930 RepID=A0A2N9F355_FAGSY
MLGLRLVKLYFTRASNTCKCVFCGEGGPLSNSFAGFTLMLLSMANTWVPPHHYLYALPDELLFAAAVH